MVVVAVGSRRQVRGTSDRGQGREAICRAVCTAGDVCKWWAEVEGRRMGDNRTDWKLCSAGDLTLSSVQALLTPRRAVGCSGLGLGGWFSCGFNGDVALRSPLTICARSFVQWLPAAQHLRPPTAQSKCAAASMQSTGEKGHSPLPRRCCRRRVCHRFLCQRRSIHFRLAAQHVRSPA